MPEEYSHRPSAASNGAGLVLLVLFLVFAIPLTLLFAAGAGYFFMSSGSPPDALYGTVDRPQATGGLIYQNRDSRFNVSVVRTKTPDGEYVVGMDYGPNLRHNQLLRVPAGEYRAEVKADGMVVREDTFTVNANGAPTTYNVGAGGTLRFIAEPRDSNLVLVLNHITGQSIWDWPQRQSFVVPEGLVHVDLRRPLGNGSYHILTNNYFDIVAGQETVIRVREKDIELVNEGIDVDPIVAAQRRVLEAVEADYSGGKVTKGEVVAAQLGLAEARLHWATQEDRHALEVSIRQEIVALSKENERLVRLQHEAGRVPEQAVHEAHVATLKEQEELKRTVADLKKSGKLPADFEWPPPAQEKEAQTGPSDEKAESPPRIKPTTQTA